MVKRKAAAPREPKPVLFHVWVCVEKEDPNAIGVKGADEFADVDLPFSKSATFDNEDDATAYAAVVNDYAKNTRRVLRDESLSASVMGQALAAIAAIPANSNSDPDVMGEALDRAQSIAADALVGHHSTPGQLQVLAQKLYDTADDEGMYGPIMVGRDELIALMDAITLFDTAPKTFPHTH